MAFTGFSSDEEGSIVFDGEQFIINNPDNVPPDFDPGDRPVIYTRPPVVPSTPVPPPTAPVQQSQPESTSESTQSSQTFRLGERILRRNRERARQDAATQSKAPSLQVIDEVPDFAELGYIDSEPLPVSEAPDWPGSTPLSQGQRLHVDHLLSTETDTLAREVLIGIRREGIPPEALLYDFMSQYAEWGWDDLSSAWAVQVLNMIRQSDWDEVFAHADSTPVETIAQDLGNNTREGLVIIDAGSGNVVLNKTGVRGPGGQQYVGLQDYEVEALRGLDLIFVHNHTNDTGASKDDLLSAFDAGAKLLIVITQSGREQVYIRGRYGMVEVRDAKASYKVGSPTLDETIALANKSAEQAAAYREDPPEYVFLQEDPEFRDRLINIAQELNLDSEPSDLSVIELLDTILALVPDNLRAFGTAATMYLRTGFENPGTTLSAIGHLNVAKYIRLISEVTGGDPGLLSSIVTWEDRARSENPAERGSYSLAKILGAKTFGPAQINIDTAIDMLTKYPKLFELDDGGELEGKIDGMRPDGNFLRDEVGHHLFYSYDFAAAVAGVYVMHINDRLKADMRDYTVEITDAHTEDPRSISMHQLQMMTAIGYNQGEHQAIARLNDRFIHGGVKSLREIIQRMKDTYTPDHIRNPSSLVGLQATLQGHLKDFNRAESDAGIDPSLSISEGELRLLTLAAHVEGLDYILDNFERVGAANVVAGVENTLNVNDYDDNVLGMQGKALELYGLSYEGDPNES